MAEHTTNRSLRRFVTEKTGVVQFLSFKLEFARACAILLAASGFSQTTSVYGDSSTQAKLIIAHPKPHRRIRAWECVPLLLQLWFSYMTTSIDITFPDR
jgi:hypothetical protein